MRRLKFLANRGQGMPAVENVIENENMSIFHVRRRDLLKNHLSTGLSFPVITRDAQAIQAQRQLDSPH